MDKRTIVFVLLVAVTFFGLNIYFSSQRDNKNRELLAQKHAKQARSTALKTSEIEKRTEKLQNLPIVSIYSDKGESSKLGQGINVDGTTLTLAWDDNLPSSVYVNGKEQLLITEDSVARGPVVFASEGFKDFDIASLPEGGAFDVQLITFPQAKVYLAEYQDGTLSIPEGPISSNAIALYQTPKGWLPLGFYESRGDAFVEMQNLPVLSGYTKASMQSGSVVQPKEEKYYVLENAYQQLVFSNIGGALVEINLPLSNEDSHSVVNEIGFDREIEEDSPINAHFPGRPYYTADSTEEQPIGQVGGYYPLIRRGITNKKTIAISPEYYALNIVSEYPEMAELAYEVKEFSKNKIVFEARQPHRKITKTFTLHEGSDGAPYVFDLSIKVDGDSRGLWLASGVPEVEIMSNSSSPQIQYRISRKGKSEVQKLDLPKVKEAISVSSAYPDWVVNSNGYLGIIMDPLSEISPGYRAIAIPGNKVPTRLSVIDPEYNPYPASKYPGYEILLPIPSSGGTIDFRIYSGPFEEATLKTVDKIYSDPSTGYNPDYIACRTFYGWFSFISKPFAKVLFVVMSFFHTITGSWGFSIILLTIFLRLLLYPLNAWSFKSMRRMQHLAPQIQAIQKKHKKDPKKSQMEIMTLYREKKVNPFTGCIPILIQLPFLIAMFDLLKSSFQLRGAVFIPGWINNLTAPDVLFQWKQPIFFIGNQFHLLPVLLGVVMFIQQRISAAKAKDPTKMTDQQKQQKAMGSIMTVVFTVMFYHFPSGLNLYWLSSMLLGILQQWVTNKILDKNDKKPKVIVMPKNSK